ncbi:sigma 54-interacting transcriptional regulator [Sedimentibacter hydroxybenzoicus DSM 7310]|uniref:Sigma 54-interacting transcriptional regulator n=1 Tax=Sedimentibacter hydroxybenzoicus DSM 7310 TaxID=1123245 RepID=A0A974BM73_SEDHY|nr:sigma 54-interacting transcriptional regulator [Sedimentibacter hydroxybenzoicus]NYB75391.1 sigma 54-interacting transcriptional regulator [Sedimentibacter hydroxybenzoicus DSM 7310]
MKAKEYLSILQNILRYIDEGVHVLDKNGNTIIYNEAMSKLEKMETKEVMKKPFSEVFKNLNIENSTLLKALESRIITSNLKQTYLNKDGREITTINTTLPVVINDEVIAVVEVAKNITKMTEMSHTILKLQNEIGKPEKAKTKKIRKYNFNNIIGKSDSFMEVVKRAKKASRNSASVFIVGETGTGKELIAQSIHFESARRDKPFIAQNCAALPESLLEGLLFGTSKGGFTGAVDRAGLFEQANGGTLLLDEINSMPYELQAKLLRVLQENYIRRVGGTNDIPIDVRIISTSNESPEAILQSGRIRKDLYYRLNVIQLNVPPLRDRQEDILLLANKFINKYNERFNREILSISKEAQDCLLNYEYSGNVRELENIIMSAISMVDDSDMILNKSHFTIFDSKNSFASKEKELGDNGLEEYLGNLEKRIIEKTLRDNKYNITKSAEELKIKRQTLQHKIKKYKIK